MLEPGNQRLRNVADVTSGSPEGITLEYRKDLVVGHVTVGRADAADNDAGHEQLRPRDRSLAQHADVERIAVAVLYAFGERCHTRATVRSRDEPVERRRQRRRALRPVDAQVA